MSIAPDCCATEESSRSVMAPLDPRTRLLAAACFLTAIVALRSLPMLALALVGAAALVLLARLPWQALQHRLMHVEGFMVILLLFLPFTVPGTELFSLGPISASREGLLRALEILLRVNAAVLAVFALLGGLEPVRLGQAAARLGVPHKLVHLFLFTVRYVGLVQAEAGRLVEAMRARGFVARSNWHTWRTLGNFAGLVLVRSLDRAERVQEAMRCRGFAGRFPLTADLAFARQDLGFAAIGCGAAVTLVLADRLA